MKRVVVCWSSRSEKGLLDPVIKRLQRHFEVVEYYLGVGGSNPQELGRLYEAAYWFLQKCRPDLVVTPFDRKEQVFVALAARMLNLRIAQFGAGDISLEGTWDDLLRHAISLCCDYLFCNTHASYLRAKRLAELTGSGARVFEVGSTAFDDVVVDESACPRVPFDLVLYNPPTRRPDLIAPEVREIGRLLDKRTVWVGPSGDPGSDEVSGLAMGLAVEKLEKFTVTFRADVPRSQYLGLMKRCERAIGNSSSFFAELPFFGKRHVHIGVRNRGREVAKIRTGGSDRIAEILNRELNKLPKNTRTRRP